MKLTTYCLIAHHYLCYNVGVLHCDLSVNNILLNRTDNELEASGLLIDFDYSVDINLQEFADDIIEQDADIAANTSFIVGTPSTSSKWIRNDVMEHNGANATVPDTVRTVRISFLNCQLSLTVILIRAPHPIWQLKAFSWTQLSYTNPVTILNRFFTSSLLSAQLSRDLANCSLQHRVRSAPGSVSMRWKTSDIAKWLMSCVPKEPSFRISRNTGVTLFLSSRN